MSSAAISASEAAINAVVVLTPFASVGLTNVVETPIASGPLVIISTISSTLFAISVILPVLPVIVCETTVCFRLVICVSPATLCAVVFRKLIAAIHCVLIAAGS